MADSINNKAKEYYDNDDTGGSLNNNLKDFLKQQGAEGNSLNTLWRNYAYGEGGNSLNTRLGKLWGTSGSLISRWKDVLGLTWDELKLFFNARRNDPELLLSGATSFDTTNDYIDLGDSADWDFGTGDWSFAHWIKITENVAGYSIWRGTGTTRKWGMLFDHNNDQFYYAAGSGLSGQSVASGNNTAPVNTWHHVVYTRSSGTGSIYINGVLMNTVSNDTQNHSYSDSIVLGNGQNLFTSKLMANVGIWNRAISASEIESIYWKGQYADLKGTELTNLVSWYNLKDTVLGSNLVTNGDFASDSDWTKVNNVTIANGIATMSGDSGTADLKQTNPIPADKRSQIQFTILSSDVSSNTGLQLMSTYGIDVSQDDDGNYIKDVGTHTITGTSSSADQLFFRLTSGAGTLTVDDVSVKEVLAKDSEGTNNGTIVGATTLTDAYSASSPFLPRIQDKASDTVANYGEVYGGNAVSFDGTNDYIDTGNAFQSTFRDSFSVSMWVKPDDGQPSAESSFFGTRNSTSQDWIQSNLHTDGKVSFFYRSDNDTAEAKTSSAVFANGVTSWTHITYVADDSDDQLKIYVNGSIVSVTNGGLGSITMADWTSSDELFIGARDNNGTAEKFFDGSINNVKVFNTVLTQDQVRELYTKPELTLSTGIASSALKLDMPMQEGSGTAILDGSGNQNHGTGSGITWATGQEYGFQHPLVRSNNPMVFDGSDDIVNLNQPSNLNFNTDADDFTIAMWFKIASGDTGTLICKGGDTSGDRQYHIYYSSSDFIAVNIGGTVVNTNAYDDENWHHVAVVNFDDSGTQKFRIYIDGSSVGIGNSGSGSNSLDVLLGARRGSSNSNTAFLFTGMINDVAIWSSALTANEVTALYNSGLPLLPTADSGNYASSSDLVGYWRNDGVTTWLDRSTNSNNGTVSGSPASIIVPEGLNEGRDSQGYYLTDTDSISSGIRFKGAEYISVQDSESLDFGTSDFSIALWVKPNENIGATRGLIYKGADGSDEGYYLRVDSTKKIRWKLNDGSTDVSDLTTQTISQDVWTYITFVADRSGNGQIYLNGVLDSDSVSSISSVGDITSTENLYIGQYNTTSEFNGSIDEVKIYDKALSATEVLKNYNNGKSAHTN